jgi:glutamate/tyrosine decarboxylase-like PLP-dependent enzyme
MAYVPGGGLPSAAIGDFLAALTNRYSGNYGACPAAAEIENVCVRWIIDMVGFPKTSWGVLTSGGTSAALAAFVAARNTRPFVEWSKGVIYVTSECHHSIPKVLNTVGLGEITQRTVPTNSQFQMDPLVLTHMIVEDMRQGLKPWIVCATAGTTNTGAVDPLKEISGVCKQHDLWLHVDGAYGGFFVVTEMGRPLLKDMSLADSLVLDPHKSLFLPYGMGAVVVRDRKLIESSFSFHPYYLTGVHPTEELSPSDYAPEGTRHFRALRMWLSLKIHGMDRITAALEEKLILAQYAHETLQRNQQLEMGPPPQLSCVTFRVAGDGDEKTHELLEKILHRSHVHLSSTRLNGRLFLRLCIMNFRTHLKEVERAFEEILTLVEPLVNQ